MASQNNNFRKITPKRNNIVQGIVNNISNGMDSLYKKTYMTTPMNNKDLDTIKVGFNKSLDKLLDNNMDNNGQTNISTLYARAKHTNTSGNSIMNDLFEDNKFMDTLVMDITENKRLKEIDNEIDLILKFMPMLEDALDAKKDNVLSADNYSKDYINVINDNKIENFEENITILKKIYNLLTLTENAYDAAGKYGEQFIYIENYNDAFNKLLKNKPNYMGSIQSNNETYREFKSDSIMCECFDYKNINESYSLNISDDAPIMKNNLYVELNTCCIESAVTEGYIAESVKKKIQKIELSQTINPKDLNFEGLNGTEGLVDNSSNKGNGQQVKVNGSIVKVIEDRENVLPIYIENICLGYYYFECEGNEIFANNSSYQNMFTPTMRGPAMMDTSNIQAQNRERMLKAISGDISTYIDSSFINANKDLKEEIYAILKHNDMFNGVEVNKVKVTFIPPEKMVHFCFKKDPKTHRGISDLEKSLLPAKIYTYLYLNDTIGALRSHDKRIYNVKNNVDTNIAQNLLNAIGQLKKGNMGARELTSMKTMLNITGRYNDLIVPVGPSGESPIDYQVMDGRQIETKTDLMEMMQEMAVNATNVPYDYVQSRKQTDFAVRLTMSSSKFLRTTFKRQTRVEELLGQILTILYNNEFQSETYVYITVTLPPPGFLQLLNSTQLFDSVNTQVEAILAMTYDDDDDPKERKIMEKKLKRHYLKGYLDGETIDRLKKEAEIEYAQAKNKSEEE